MNGVKWTAVAVWVLCVLAVGLVGIWIPPATAPLSISKLQLAFFQVASLMAPALSIGGFALSCHRTPFHSRVLEQLVDSRFGQDRLKELLREVRPLLLLSVLCIVAGGERLYIAVRTNAVTERIFAELDISAGIGFLIMWAILRRRDFSVESTE
jgi:hypothetical protein